MAEEQLRVLPARIRARGTHKSHPNSHLTDYTKRRSRPTVRGAVRSRASNISHTLTPSCGRCPHLQAQVAQLMTHIPKKYLTKQPILSGPGRNVEL